jgi:hypothetical protein
MGHVEALAERIPFLKGDVEMSPAAPVEKTTDPAALLAKARQLEEASANAYNQAALECAAGADAASKQIFERLIGDEEGHFAAFDRQWRTYSVSARAIWRCNRSRKRRLPRLARSACVGMSADTARTSARATWVSRDSRSSTR